VKSKAAALAVGCLFVSALALAQRGAENQAPAAETTAPNIPGVVAGGTRVQLIKENFQGAQGAVAGPDGSLLFTERGANRITKIDKDNNISSYMENTNATNSAAFDSKGRLIGVQWMPPQLPCSRRPGACSPTTSRASRSAARTIWLWTKEAACTSATISGSPTVASNRRSTTPVPKDG
jgi:hypothetical protein